MKRVVDWPQLNWALSTELSLKEARRATKNFDHSLIIGVSGHGNVYGGVVDGGRQVAVKRWNKNSKKGLHQLENELSMLTKLTHRGLIWIGGSCNARGEKILLYEYMKHGSLRDNLYNFREGFQKPYLSWVTRLGICIEVSRAIHYLHKGAEDKHVHGDIHTKNIFLDERLSPKVSGFSYAKRVSKQDPDPSLEVSKASVSPGYMDPEATKTGKLTRKSDVYAFGVVLLEVLCARPAVDTRLPPEQVNLVQWVFRCQESGNLEAVVDPLMKGKIKPEGLSTYVEIARDCLAAESVQRPYLTAVEESLELVLCMQGPDEDKDIYDGNKGFLETWNSIDEKQKHKKSFWKRIGKTFY